MGVWYATREDVLSAIDIQESTRSSAQVDRALESASRSIEGLLHRKFYPWTGTRYFPWPSYQYARSWRLWLDQDELISVSAFTAGGVTIDTDDLLLEPVNSGPPYTRIEADLSSSAAFSSGDSHQRAIAITGVFGYSADEEANGTSPAINDSQTTLFPSGSSAVSIGVGSILRVDDERMIVTGKEMQSTLIDQTLQADLTASMADVSVSVEDGTGFAVGETVLLDSERMSIVDIAGNTLTVRRAVDGSVLATHSGSAIFGLRTVNVTRGALGTTAATHSNAASIHRLVIPGLVRELCIAEAVNTLQQEQSAYARVVGEGDNAIEVRGVGLTGLRLDALDRYGRRARTRAI